MPSPLRKLATARSRTWNRSSTMEYAAGRSTGPESSAKAERLLLAQVVAASLGVVLDVTAGGWLASHSRTYRSVVPVRGQFGRVQRLGGQRAVQPEFVADEHQRGAHRGPRSPIALPMKAFSFLRQRSLHPPRIATDQAIKSTLHPVAGVRPTSRVTSSTAGTAGCRAADRGQPSDRRPRCRTGRLRFARRAWCC